MEQMVIEVEKRVYTPGEYVTGKVIITLKKEINVSKLEIGLHGTAFTKWYRKVRRVMANRRNQNEVYGSSLEYTSGIEYVNDKIVKKAQELNMRVGENIFLFSFKLPINCPSSYNGDKGLIKYKLNANLIQKYRLDKKIHLTLDVRSRVDLNTIPISIEPKQLVTTKMYGSMFKKGMVELTVNIPKYGYAPGETIPIGVSIQNGSKTKIEKVKAELIQRGTLTAKICEVPGANPYADDEDPPEEMEISETKRMTENKRKIEVMGESEGECMIPLRVPGITPTFSCCSIVSVDYFIRITISTGSAFGSDVTAGLTIMIGTVKVDPMLIDEESDELTSSEEVYVEDEDGEPLPTYEEAVYDTWNVDDGDVTSRTNSVRSRGATGNHY